jgi:4a-hydroxytetrahydrobiopterin dehydratase
VSEPDSDTSLSHAAASMAVAGIGWRSLLGTLAVSVPMRSLARASEIAAASEAVGGQDADRHRRVGMRPSRVELSIQTRTLRAATSRDTRLAYRIAMTGSCLPPPARRPPIHCDRCRYWRWPLTRWT